MKLPILSSPFLSEESSMEWWSMPGVVQKSSNFSVAAYDDTLFQILGIEFPVSLASAVVKRKAEFLAGRYCAKRALLALEKTTTAVGLSDNRSPIWPKNIIGSISHSNFQVVAIASQDPAIGGLGIDIERRVKKELVWELWSQIINNNERHWLEHEILAPEDAFTLIFSAKESLFKALYPNVKIYFGFDAASVVAFDLSKHTIHLMLNKCLGGKWPRGAIIIAQYKELESGSLATYVQV